MMAGCKYILFFFALIFPLLAVQEEIAFHYENGMNAYRIGQFDLAVQEFEVILENNWDFPELYYNLGNAFYRNGNTAGAVWAYESCLKLSPTHTNASYNLKLANLKVKDRVDLPKPPLYLKWYLGIKEQFTPSEWINISLFILLLFSLAAILCRFLSNSVLYNLRGIVLGVLFVAMFFTVHSIWTKNSVKEGIIYDMKVEVRSEPNSFSTRLFEVHAGLKVSVGQISYEWIAIELLDGKTGWVEENDIRLIR